MQCVMRALDRNVGKMFRALERHTLSIVILPGIIRYTHTHTHRSQRPFLLSDGSEAVELGFTFFFPLHLEEILGAFSKDYGFDRALGKLVD